MNILPELSKVREIAARKKYDVLPVSCEILSDICTPIEAMKILKNVSTHCYMLESALADEKWGRYTFLGFDPKMEITCAGGEMKAGSIRLKTDDPSGYLRQILSEYRSPRFDYLPSFTGGLVGYFSYDYLGYSEPAVRTDAEDTESFKDVDVMLFDKVIAFDHFRQKIILIVNMPLKDVEVSYNRAALELKRLVDLLRNGEKKNEPGGRILGEVTPLFEKEAFCDMVEKAKQHIREGDIFQIVLSNRLSAPFEGGASEYLPGAADDQSIALYVLFLGNRCGSGRGVAGNAGEAGRRCPSYISAGGDKAAGENRRGRPGS